jgi:hypothetical protein
MRYRYHSANASINTERITLYGEIEEGKEGNMSDVAVDTNYNTNTITNTNSNTIYAGIRYYQGVVREYLLFLILIKSIQNLAGLITRITFPIQ